jgi:hypothetical protein
VIQSDEAILDYLKKNKHPKLKRPGIKSCKDLYDVNGDPNPILYC